LYLGYTLEWNNQLKAEYLSNSLQSSATSDKLVLLSVPKIVLCVPKLKKTAPGKDFLGPFFNE